MNKPCWKLAKACPQSQKLFCFGENNLLKYFNIEHWYYLTLSYLVTDIECSTTWFEQP